jgi:hypothetical protein
MYENNFARWQMRRKISDVPRSCKGIRCKSEPHKNGASEGGRAEILDS